MSRTHRPRRTLHDFLIGELVTLAEPVAPFQARIVVQIVGFRGDTLLRVLPIGGVPILAPFDTVARVGLPRGSEKPPYRHRRTRRPRPAQQAATA